MENLSFTDLVTAITLFVGLIFAVVEIRHFRLAHKREAAITLMQSFLSTDYNNVIPLVFNMPENLSHDEVVEYLGGETKIFNLLTTIESIGILVFQREVGLDMVGYFFSSPISEIWRKLRNYVEYVREDTGYIEAWEWVQWIYEQMEKKRESKPLVPAYIQHKDWKAE